MLKIKDNVDLSILEKYGYNEDKDCYFKMCGKRDVFVWKHNREIIDCKCDKTTHTGYAYECEYRHVVKRYIQDLIKADLVEKVEDK